MTTNTFYAPDTRSSWEKLLDRMFPSQLCETPEAPADFKDVLFNKTVVVLPLADRIRVLLSGKLAVSSRTVTENTVGRAITNSVAYPLRPMSVEEAFKRI